jgi:hypothetical protein
LQDEHEDPVLQEDITKIKEEQEEKQVDEQEHGKSE